MDLDLGLEERGRRYDRFPEFLNRDLSQAKSLTRVLAQVDPKLVAAWNRRSEQWEVWGPSREYGWACISECLNPFTGQPCPPELYPMVILEDLRRREQKSPGERELLERRAQYVEREWMKWIDEAGEAAAWLGKAAAQEISGTPIRYGLSDALLGWDLAKEGRSRGPAVGRQIFLPGRGR